MKEEGLGSFDRGIYTDPDPQDSGFGHFYKPRKIARIATKSGQGAPGSRSKDERRIRRQKRAQRSR